MKTQAVTYEHVEFYPNWSTEHGRTVRTRWFNTKTEADAQAEAYRVAGADLTRVHLAKSCLGMYKVLGHFFALSAP